ncbi:MAG: sensor histidine kinase [Anaerolineae bacterium]|nr:sensor histidine kinase [Anaerolineae bacterium]
MRMASVLAFIGLVGFNIYNANFWRTHPSLGIDVDYDTGRIMEIFLGSDIHQLVTFDDRVVMVNGLPAAEFRPLRDLKTGEVYQLRLRNLDGTERSLDVIAEIPDRVFRWEHTVFPLIGLSFYSFAVALILMVPVNRVNGTFAMYMFLSAGLFSLFNLERYIQGGTGFWSHLLMILVVLAGIEFHWPFLNIQLSNKVLMAARWMITTMAVVYSAGWWLIEVPNLITNKIIFYVFWALGFLFILFLFTVQYVYDELSRGNLRIMLLTFFTALGPMLYFVLIPLMLGYPRTMPSIISVIPMLLIPVNYSLLIQRKKQYTRVTCTILSFMLTLLVIYFFAEVSYAVAQDWSPLLGVYDRTWLSQLILAALIGIGIILYHYVSRFVQRFVYGDASREAQQMQQLSLDLSEAGDNDLILVQTAQIFQKFFNFTYLKISLQNGRCFQFNQQGEVTPMAVDPFEVMSVINRITFRQQAPDRQMSHNIFIELASIDDLVLEYEKIFGDTPEYVFLLEGRSYPVGVISAGPRKNGERFDAIEISQLDALLRQYQVIVENLFLMQEVERRSQQVRKMGQQLLEAREDERKRIARDMHDNIIQSLTAFRYTMNELYDKDKLAISDEEADELQHSLQTISQDIRDICFNLRPPALDATGFRSAVISIAESHHRNYHLNTHLEVSDSPVIDQLSDMVSICLYRVLQEALLNIEKHARTDSAWVVLDANEGLIEMRVEDNGVGFQVPEGLEELVTAGHFGLTGIQEFLEIVNGSLTIASRPGEGATLIARIPLEKIGGENESYYDHRR